MKNISDSFRVFLGGLVGLLSGFVSYIIYSFLPPEELGGLRLFGLWFLAGFWFGLAVLLVLRRGDFKSIAKTVGFVLLSTLACFLAIVIYLKTAFFPPLAGLVGGAIVISSLKLFNLNTSTKTLTLLVLIAGVLSNVILFNPSWNMTLGIDLIFPIWQSVMLACIVYVFNISHRIQNTLDLPAKNETIEVVESENIPKLQKDANRKLLVILIIFMIISIGFLAYKKFANDISRPSQPVNLNFLKTKEVLALPNYLKEIDIHGYVNAGNVPEIDQVESVMFSVGVGNGDEISFSFDNCKKDTLQDSALEKYFVEKRKVTIELPEKLTNRHNYIDPSYGYELYMGRKDALVVKDEDGSVLQEFGNLVSRCSGNYYQIWLPETINEISVQSEIIPESFTEYNKEIQGDFYQKYGFTFNIPDGFIPKIEELHSSPATLVYLPIGALGYVHDVDFWEQYNIASYTLIDANVALGNVIYKKYLYNDTLHYWFKSGQIGYEFGVAEELEEEFEKFLSGLEFFPLQ